MAFEAAATSSNSGPKDDDDVDAWDALCIDPHHKDIEAGRDQGREAGLAAGFNDGRAIGVLKGIEYGMEIGFMQGALRGVMESLQTNKKHSLGDEVQQDRIQKTADSLQKLLDEFPPPDQLFQENATTLLREGPNNNDEHNNDDSEIIEESPSSVDLSAKMQKLKSRFKLLTVQLKWGQFSLKTVMNAQLEILEGNNASAATEASQTQIATTEW